MSPSDLARFRAQTDQRGPGECWPWTGPVNERGYGTTTVGRRTKRAHRVAYALLHGNEPVNDGDHTCHNQSDCAGGISCSHRRCVNPAHIEDVTRSVNLARGRTGGQPGQRVSACPAGHPRDADNERLRPDGSWYCRECNRQRAARRRAAA